MNVYSKISINNPSGSKVSTLEIEILAIIDSELYEFTFVSSADYSNISSEGSRFTFKEPYQVRKASFDDLKSEGYKKVFLKGFKRYSYGMLKPRLTMAHLNKILLTLVDCFNDEHLQGSIMASMIDLILKY